MKKQYNLVKIISIMFFAFLTFFVMNKVHAENIITGDYVGKTYLKKEKAGHQSMYLRSQWVLRKSDNKFVYCLEPWVRVDSDQIYTY